MAKAPKSKSGTIVQAANAPELFADGVASVAVRRNVARMTLVSDRVDLDSSDETDRVAVGHIAMSLPGFLDLYARMQNIVDQMRERGAVSDLDPAAGATASPAASKAAPKKAAKKATRTKK